MEPTWIRNRVIPPMTVNKWKCWRRFGCQTTPWYPRCFGILSWWYLRFLNDRELDSFYPIDATLQLPEVVIPREYYTSKEVTEDPAEKECLLTLLEIQVYDWTCNDHQALTNHPKTPTSFPFLPPSMIGCVISTLILRPYHSWCSWTAFVTRQTVQTRRNFPLVCLRGWNSASGFSFFLWTTVRNSTSPPSSGSLHPLSPLIPYPLSLLLSFYWVSIEFLNDTWRCASITIISFLRWTKIGPIPSIASPSRMCFPTLRAFHLRIIPSCPTDHFVAVISRFAFGTSDRGIVWTVANRIREELWRLRDARSFIFRNERRVGSDVAFLLLWAVSVAVPLRWSGETAHESV